jgi:hypothetical protein
MFANVLANLKVSAYDESAQKELLTAYAFRYAEGDRSRLDMAHSIAHLENAIDDVGKYLGEQNAAAAFVLAVANTALTREILDMLINGCGNSSAKGNAAPERPRQSNAYQLLEIEAECGAAGSVLLEVLRAQAIGGEQGAASPHAFTALIASQRLVEQLSRLLCGWEMREPNLAGSVSPGSLIRLVSDATQINRHLGNGGALHQCAVQSRMGALKVA